MVAHDGRPGAPQVLFSLVLGIVLAALIGGGVYLLYPSDSNSAAQLQKLNGQQTALETSRRVSGGMSKSHETYYKKVVADIASQKQALEVAAATRVRNMSIILVALATLMMVASLSLFTNRRSISDGLLLGGFLTALLGVALPFSAGDSASRYAILCVGIAVVAVVGYLRFVRMPKLGERSLV